MDRLYDPRLFPLPHPVRTDAVLGSDLDARVFQELGLTTELKPYLTDDTLSTEGLINHLPLLHLFAQAHIGLPGSVNLGTFILMMSRARLRAHGDPPMPETPIRYLTVLVTLGLVVGSVSVSHAQGRSG